MSGSHGDDGIRRKKLLFRSWHRGTRELDLIFGAFADAAIETLDAGQLDDYERLLNLPDSDLMDWLLGNRRCRPRSTARCSGAFSLSGRTCPSEQRTPL